MSRMRNEEVAPTLKLNKDSGGYEIKIGDKDYFAEMCAGRWEVMDENEDVVLRLPLSLSPQIVSLFLHIFVMGERRQMVNLGRALPMLQMNDDFFVLKPPPFDHPIWDSLRGGSDRYDPGQ